MQDYRKLKVWEKAHTVAMDIHRTSKAFRRQDAIAVRGQLQRAALSIPANIAEGSGKLSDSEFARYLEIALGSASEAQYHLVVAREIGELDVTVFNDLSDRITEVRRMLFGLIKRIRADVARKQPTSTTNGASS
jgi:four helix bundle protein